MQPVLAIDQGTTPRRAILFDAAMQFWADIIGAKADRPKGVETTALGAAWLAGHRAGLYPDQAGFAANWALERVFAPPMAEGLRAEKYAAWKRAVVATMAF